MEPDNFQWSTFYTNVSGRQPRQQLVDALQHYYPEAADGRQAIDLGCGDGTETALLLANGWRVLAIDGEPTAFDHLKAKIPSEAQTRLQTQTAPFEGVRLVPADLIHASYSIPFCQPDYFNALWGQITENLNSGGRFVGQLFGVHDTWASNPKMTFFTREQVDALLTELAVEELREEDEDGASTVGPKHWHIFHIVARKR